jgi:pimeloyl-ACP methyl ester carboxylesterase
VARQLAAILTQKNRKPELGSVSVPTLVIHGADDPLVPAAIDRKTQLTAIGGLFASFSATDPFGFYRIIK